MTLRVDGVNINSVQVDGVDINELQINDLTVWVRANQLVDLTGIPDTITSDAYVGLIIASYGLFTAGNHEYVENNVTTPVVPDWLVSGLAADYELRMTQVAGYPVAGSPVGVWGAMDDSDWWLGASDATGSRTATMLLEVRLISTLEVTASKNFVLEATVLT